MTIVYLDEAVVKVEPEQGSGNPGILGDGVFEDRHYDLVGLRARVVVEGGGETGDGGRESLRRGAGEGGEGDEGEDEQGRGHCMIEVDEGCMGID